MPVAIAPTQYGYSKWGVIRALLGYFEIAKHAPENKADIDRAIDSLAPHKGWLAFSTDLTTEWEYFVKTLTVEQQLVVDIILSGCYTCDSETDAVIEKMVDFLNKGNRGEN